jgi:hypothetical protein
MAMLVALMCSNWTDRLPLAGTTAVYHTSLVA